MKRHEFVHGLVVECPGWWVGIVTTERENEDGWPCLSAFKSAAYNWKWIIHYNGHCSQLETVVPHPDPDTILADYTRALLLDEVQIIED